MQLLNALTNGSVGLNLSGRNLLINGDFAINQRSYVSGASLAAQDTFGHDGWRNGSTSSQSYTFTQASQADGVASHPIATTITIPSTLALQQFVEAANNPGSPMTLSWVGTATGAVYQNNGSSSYTTVLASGVSGRSFTPSAGTTLIVELSNGTVNKAQLEFGTIQSQYERISMEERLSEAMRYYQAQAGMLLSGYAGNGGSVYGSFGCYPMRVSPTVAISGQTYSNSSNLRINSVMNNQAYSLGLTIVASGSGYGYGNVTLTAEIPR